MMKVDSSDIVSIGCHICFEDYSSSEAHRMPKVIPCGHTLCLHCLQLLFKKWPSPDCPFCSETIPLPLKKIPTNFGILDIMNDMHQTTSATRIAQHSTESHPCKRRKIVTPRIHVDDIVERGPDWKWGDQDGGAGHRGIVMDTRVGDNNVRVMWDTTATENFYRWGQDGCYDLKVCVPANRASNLSVISRADDYPEKNPRSRKDLVLRKSS